MSNPPYLLKNKAFIIGIFGCSGVGKDTVGAYIEHKYKRAYTAAFADPVKFAAANAFGISIENFYAEKKALISPFWDVTPRQIVQFFGTELFREAIQRLLPNIRTDFWVHRLAGAIDGVLTAPLDNDDNIYFDKDDTVVITDGRFNNELDFVLANGGIAIHLDRVVAPVTGGISGHKSEFLDFNEFLTLNPNYYHLDNNGTLEDLYVNVTAILSQHYERIVRKSTHPL